LSGLDRLTLAKSLALLVPAALLAGAWGSQIWGGLVPCEYCWWQRYAHLAALVPALGAWIAGRSRGTGGLLVRLAALAILASGAIGFYQAGVEAKIFKGLTQCTAGGAGLSGDALLKHIMDAPMIRCDEVQWSLMGISMAGWNGIVSISAALLILWLSLGRAKTKR
jgi:disulfide bond formation protein DsbB